MSIKIRAAALLAALLLSPACSAADPGGAPTPALSGRPGASDPTSGQPGPGPAGRGELRIIIQLGDQCPHIPTVPDPSCVPKPRSGTGYAVGTENGGVVTRGRSGADGRAVVPVPAGDYVVRGEPVAGYRITPERRVRVSESESVEVPLTYTNGIQ